MLSAFAFYLFAALLVSACLMVIRARNPVYSVLFLVFAFFNAAALFILLGAEFVAMILVIVYVGAVAVLFLFVVMMLDISFENFRKEARRYLPAGIAVGAILLGELVLVYTARESLPIVLAESAARVANPAPEGLENTHALGRILYTDYLVPFQAAGIILLVAMVGTIVLTNRRRSDVRRQRVSDQVARRPQDVLEIVRMSPSDVCVPSKEEGV